MQTQYWCTCGSLQASLGPAAEALGQVVVPVDQVSGGELQMLTCVN